MADREKKDRTSPGGGDAGPVEAAVRLLDSYWLNMIVELFWDDGCAIRNFAGWR